MRKANELTNPDSCLSRAKPHEWLFVLLGRDEDAPATIRYWVSKRIARGKNHPGYPQIIDALACAAAMERERADKAAEPAREECLGFVWLCKCGRLNPINVPLCLNRQCGETVEGKAVYSQQPPATGKTHE